MTTKNLGLVKAIDVALTAPSNTAMLWYDDNAGIKYHKYYNTVSSSWVPLASGGISTANNGLSVSSGIAQLGGTLIQNTSIDFDTFKINFVKGANPLMEINNNGVATIGNNLAGDKILLNAGAVDKDGLGIQNLQFQYFVANVNSSHVFGQGSSGTFNPYVWITGTGNMGVGIIPLFRFQVNVGTDQNVIMNTNTGLTTIQAVSDDGNTNVPLQFYATAYSFKTGALNVGLGNITLGVHTVSPTVSAIYMGVTPSGDNYSIAQIGGATYINGTSTISHAINGSVKGITQAAYTQFTHPFSVGSLAPSGANAFVVTGETLLKGVGGTNSTFNLKTQDVNANALFYLTDNGQYMFNSRLDGTSSGVPNYKHSTNSGGLRIEYNSDASYGSQLVFLEATVQKGSIGCTAGITVIQGSYRVALKDQNTNKNKLWLDNNTTGFVGVGDDYFAPDAMFHVNGTTATAILGFKYADSANLNILKGRNDGYMIQRAVNAAISDGSLSTNELSWYIDEGGSSIIAKVKFSGGTVKTFTGVLV